MIHLMYSHEEKLHFFFIEKVLIMSMSFINEAKKP